MSQVLDTDKSCHNAVSRIISWLAGEGEEIPSEDTSAKINLFLSPQLKLEKIWQDLQDLFAKYLCNY